MQTKTKGSNWKIKTRLLFYPKRYWIDNKPVFSWSNLKKMLIPIQHNIYEIFRKPTLETLLHISKTDDYVSIVNKFFIQWNYYNCYLKELAILSFKESFTRRKALLLLSINELIRTVFDLATLVSKKFFCKKEMSNFSRPIFNMINYYLWFYTVRNAWCLFHCWDDIEKINIKYLW